LNPFPTILLKVFGPPLGTALAGLAAEIIRKRLSIGRVEENSKRLHAIRELIEAETLELSATEKSALQDEAALIAKSLQILRKRAASLKSTADTIQDWSHQPVFRRIFTLPRPRSSNGWIASAACLLFLYWTAFTAFTITTELNDIAGAGFLALFIVSLYDSHYPACTRAHGKGSCHTFSPGQNIWVQAARSPAPVSSFHDSKAQRPVGIQGSHHLGPMLALADRMGSDHTFHSFSSRQYDLARSFD
jgi:hypothetical protein